MSTERRLGVHESDEGDLGDDDIDGEEYEDEWGDDEVDLGEYEAEGEFNEGEGSSCGPWIPSSSKRMKKCDTHECLDHDLLRFYTGGGGIIQQMNDIVEASEHQDADYMSLPQLSDELETMIMARAPILDFRKLCLLNKKYLEITKNGDLLKERKLVGVREACVFMLTSGEESWWAFDEHFISPKALPILPCDDAFKSLDKETLCVGTNLLVCGYDCDGPVIWTYDLILNRWYKGPSMFKRRCLFASASCGDFAFVAGGIGLDSNKFLKSAEKYNPITNSWDIIPKMIERRKMCSGVYMDNKFYVIGGQNQNGDVLTCAEIFDEEGNEWEKIPGMLNGLATSQSPPLVAVVNNELYLFETSLNSLLVYLKDKKSWKDLGPVPVRADINRGWGVAFKSMGDKLLVIGGSMISPSSRGMTIYTCVPNPNAESLNWKLLAGGVGNSRSHFIRNCTVMVA